MHKKRLILALLAGVAMTGAAQAALHDRGSGLIYDDVLKITWLQDANYAKTSGYDTDGKMTWADANTWAANLSYGGFDDWRLPTMIDTGAPGGQCTNSGTDCGYNVQTVSGSTVYSEMAHMYHTNLGLKSPISPTGDPLADFGIFGNGTTGGQNDVGLIDNLQSSAYWSGLGYAPISYYAWVFSTNIGNQGEDYKVIGHYAWAVRPGDVAAVPEADTWAMLLAGLGLVSMAARRRRG